MVLDDVAGVDQRGADLFLRAELAICESQLLRDEQRRLREELRQTLSKVRAEIHALRREQQLSRCQRGEISISAK